MDNTQLILKMYKNNIGIFKIATILDVPQYVVYETLSQNGINVLDAATDERDSEVKKLYMSGIGIKAIAKKLGIDRHTVTNIAQRYGIYKGNINAKINDPEKEERNKKVIELYFSGKSARETAKIIGVCASTVCKIINAFGYDTRPQHQKGHSAGTTRNRKHFFNIDFFEKIDTEEKAYWLGFLYADGCIQQRGLISIALQEKDKHLLEQFKKSIKANTIEIKYEKKTKSYRIDICSVKMANDLVKLGCLQHKSLRLVFPTEDQVPENLINHFMRGYFDGDGCMYVNEKRKSSSAFSVLGTNNFLDSFESILLKNCKNKRKTKRLHRDFWAEETSQITYGGKDRLIDIYNFLYKNANIYLKRKKDKFNKILPANEKCCMNSLEK